MLRKSQRRVGAVAIAASFAATAASAAPPPRAPPAARDAAMHQLQKPTGVGGCIFLGVPAEVRRAAIEQVLAGKPGSSPELQAAVAKIAPKCTGQPYSGSDTPLVMTVTANVRRAAAALYVAQAHGVGQTALDAAWRGATPQQRAPFIAVAGEAMGPSEKVTPRKLDVAPMARKAGIATPVEPVGEGMLRAYFTSTVLIEKAEAQLRARGARPTA